MSTTKFRDATRSDVKVDGALDVPGTGEPVVEVGAPRPQTPDSSRRRFLKGAATAGAAGAFYWFGPKLMFNGQQVAHAEPIAGGTLDPTFVRKFKAELVKPPALPNAHGYYRIAMRQFQQQIVWPHFKNSAPAEYPDQCPPTTVWSYGSVLDPSHEGTVAEGGTFFYPSFTIEAKVGKETVVEWRNELVDEWGNYLPHLLPVDPTLHWANPPGGKSDRDTRPDFFAMGKTYLPLEQYKALSHYERKHHYTQYTGPVPMITHLHGGRTAEQSDGYPEAWYLPAARNLPYTYAKTGTFFDVFKRKYHETSWDVGTTIFRYGNDQPATTLWFHDHALGITRLNVYAGPAGFYLLRGGVYDKDLGFKPPSETSGPFDKDITEIPIVIQDRSFNSDGSLFYPDNRAFFEGLEELPPNQLNIPFIGEASCDGPSDVPPIWNPEFFGNMMVVNGQTWPKLTVQRRRYRIRFLNGCNARFLILKMNKGVKFWQIGGDQSFLPRAKRLNKLLMAPAERADVIIDFSDLPAGTEVLLKNLGPDEPFGGGQPGSDFDSADPVSTGKVMKFVVEGGYCHDYSYNPATDGRKLPAPPDVRLPDNVRQVSLNEESSASVFVPVDGEDFVLDAGGNLVEDCSGNGTDVFGPTAALCGTVLDPNGSPSGEGLLWMDDVTENPDFDSVEEWEIYNFTVDAHPIHLHLVQFQVVGRIGLDGSDSIVNRPQTNGVERWEQGLKDTVICYPQEITRIRAHFDLKGLYVWHCHILEHEDNEMMRPYRVGPDDGRRPPMHHYRRKIGRCFPWRRIRRWKIRKNR